MSNYLIKPLPDITQLKGLLPHYLKVWYTTPLHQQTETLLRNLFCERYSNTVFENVLIKTATLNELYAAGLGQPYNMAIHIMSLYDVDNRLQTGDPKLVDEIKRLESTYTSFASKYCSFHNPDAYPIYDSFVVRVLREYNKSPNSFTSKAISFTTTKSPASYQDDFLPIVEDFRKACGLQDQPFNRLDHLLWLMGKEYFVDYSITDINHRYIIILKQTKAYLYELCIELSKGKTQQNGVRGKEYVGVAAEEDFDSVRNLLEKHCNYVTRKDGIVGEFYIDATNVTENKNKIKEGVIKVFHKKCFHDIKKEDKEDIIREVGRSLAGSLEISEETFERVCKEKMEENEKKKEEKKKKEEDRKNKNK